MRSFKGKPFQGREGAVDPVNHPDGRHKRFSYSITIGAAEWLVTRGREVEADWLIVHFAALWLRPPCSNFLSGVTSLALLSINQSSKRQ